jgi:hypothetical protein
MAIAAEGWAITVVCSPDDKLFVASPYWSVLKVKQLVAASVSGSNASEASRITLFYKQVALRFDLKTLVDYGIKNGDRVAACVERAKSPCTGLDPNRPPQVPNAYQMHLLGSGAYERIYTGVCK